MCNYNSMNKYRLLVQKYFGLQFSYAPMLLVSELVAVYKMGVSSKW